MASTEDTIMNEKTAVLVIILALIGMGAKAMNQGVDAMETHIDRIEQTLKKAGA